MQAIQFFTRRKGKQMDGWKRCDGVHLQGCQPFITARRFFKQSIFLLSPSFPPSTIVVSLSCASFPLCLYFWSFHNLNFVPNLAHIWDEKKILAQRLKRFFKPGFTAYTFFYYCHPFFICFYHFTPSAAR